MDLKPSSRDAEIWVDANAVKAPLVKPATWVAHGISGAMEFSDGTDDTVVANIRIPFRFDRSITPTFTIGWSSASTGNCEWQLEYNWSKENEDTTKAADAILKETTAASTTANGVVLTTFTEITKLTEDDICLHIRVKRLAAGSVDTIADTVEMFGMCLSFKKKEGM